MNTPASGDDTGSAGLLDDSQYELASPYPGGRAQAESGSKIIENDYNAWQAVSHQPYRLPADHPLIEQFTHAWHAVSTRGLGDDAGAASIRYRVLAHAARSLSPAASEDGHGREADALLKLWQHSLIHGRRLYATGLDRFLNSRASNRYSGFAQAAGESALIEERYQAWHQVPTATQAVPGSSLAEGAALLRQAWAGIEQHGLTDGPGPAAGRYRALADRARVVSDDFAQRLPSAALRPLLELAMYADMHSIRLRSTAIAITGDAADRPAPYRGLPAQVATTAAHGHSEIPHVGRTSGPAGNGPAAETVRKRAAQNDSERA
jgi:hypothetical protein